MQWQWVKYNNGEYNMKFKQAFNEQFDEMTKSQKGQYSTCGFEKSQFIKPTRQDLAQIEH